MTQHDAAHDADLLRGREEVAVERHAVALEHFTLAADQATRAEDRLEAISRAAQATLALERPYETIAWTERLRHESPTPDESYLLEATAWIKLGDCEQALALLDQATAPDTAHTRYPASLHHQLRAQALGQAGRVEEGLEEALTALREDWGLRDVWVALATLIAHADRMDATEAAALVPDDGVLQVLGWLTEAPAAGVDRIVEAFWQRTPGDRRILALVTTLGNRLRIERAIEWSARLRAAGLGRDCAVLGIAANDERAPRERVRAAAVAAQAFGDERATPLLELATSVLPDYELAETFTELMELAPDDLFDAFVAAAAATAARALLLAHALLARGAESPVLALARHAVELTTGQPDELATAVRAALRPPQLRALVGILGEHSEQGLAHQLMIAAPSGSAG